MRLSRRDAIRAGIIKGSVGTKYNNTRSPEFHSDKEEARYNELMALEKIGEVRNIRKQVPYPLTVDGDLICTYIADFVYFRLNPKRVGDPWGVIVEDVKSAPDKSGKRITRTPGHIIKKKLMKAIYGIEIHEV